MIRRSRNGERLFALFLLGLLLLLPPVLLVFNRPVRVLGVPLLFLYVFTAWALLIALVARLARDEDGSGPRSAIPSPSVGENGATTQTRDA